MRTLVGINFKTAGNNYQCQDCKVYAKYGEEHPNLLGSDCGNIIITTKIDPKRRLGKVIVVAELAKEIGFTLMLSKYT